MRFPARSTRAAVGLLALAGVATASHGGGPRISHYVLADGNGQLIANPGGHEVFWERCPGDQTTCVAHDDGDAQPNILRVGDEAPGTTFQATQDSITARSEPWRGRPRIVEPPRVEGDARVGGHVRPLAGTWAGGWGREKDWLQLQVCRTAAGAECKVVLDTIHVLACSHGGGRVLPARYEGWWLRVLDARIDKEQPFATIGYPTPEAIPPLQPAPGVAVGGAGRIARGSPPAIDCGSLRVVADAVVRRVIRRAERGRLVAVTATCPARCRLHLEVRQGTRSFTVRRSLPAGITRVALPRAAARRLRPGRVTIRARIDDRLVATGRAVLRLT